MALEASAQHQHQHQHQRQHQHQDDSEVYPPGDRDPDPPAVKPTIPPDTQMSPPDRGCGDDKK